MCLHLFVSVNILMLILYKSVIFCGKNRGQIIVILNYEKFTKDLLNILDVSLFNYSLPMLVTY